MNLNVPPEESPSFDQPSVSLNHSKDSLNEKKTAYFFSDAHLGVEPKKAIPGREELLIERLKACRTDASHVIILGDLFEFWYEYKFYVSREHMPLFRILGDLVDAGIQVHYLAGNHDFALEDFFQKSLGVHTAKELLLDINGSKFLCVHGDGLASSDTGYRLFRKVLDFPLNRKLFRLLHPDWGMALANWVGKNSRKYGENKTICIEEYLETGRKRMAETGAQYFIHGHHHLPGIWQVSNGKVASPGQWLFSLHYLKFLDGKLSLEHG